ncbi:hypothetical protein Tco_1409118 [Tanacetum coccineum]
MLDVPQNISDDGHDDVSQFPKKRKVSAVEELSKVIAGDYIENAAPVESEEGCGRNAFAQSEDEPESDLAEFENYSSTCKKCRDDDIEESYGEAESDNYLKDELVPFELDSVSVKSSSSTEMRGSDYDMRPHTTIEHEDTDVIELFNTDNMNAQTWTTFKIS